MVPFIPLYNNRYKTNDLLRIKCFVDAYDEVVSDFANNFIDFQELILFIKNYNENVSTETAAKELMEWLKKYKIVSVRGDGAMDIISKEVPYQARGEFLLILKKLIYSFGQGVDIDELKGSSLTNVVVKAYFALLDIKANKFIKQCRKFIKEMLKFANKYNEIKNQQGFDINIVEIVFNKSLIINEKEIIESIAAADSFTSLETQVANNPLVDNAEDELKKIEEENLQYNEPALVPGSDEE
jgi:SPP1 family phage portal protein